MGNAFSAHVDISGVGPPVFGMKNVTKSGPMNTSESGKPPSECPAITLTQSQTHTAKKLSV